MDIAASMSRHASVLIMSHPSSPELAVLDQLAPGDGKEITVQLNTLPNYHFSALSCKLFVVCCYNRHSCVQFRVL